MFSIEELSALRQGLDLVTITGVSARKMVTLQDKVEQTLQKEIEKRDRELADYIANVDAKSTPFVSMAPKGKDLGNVIMSWQVDDYAKFRNLVYVSKC